MNHQNPHIESKDVLTNGISTEEIIQATATKSPNGNRDPSLWIENKQKKLPLDLGRGRLEELNICIL